MIISRRFVAISVPLAACAALTVGVASGQEPDGAGADPNPDCTLIVPPHPLTAQGLATPYRLVATDRRKGACHESNTDQSAFVQGTVIDPATGRLWVYNPLVIDKGGRPGAAAVVPKLPAGAVVGLWFGFNGDNLTLRGRAGSLRSGRCVNGAGNSIFGQFAFCNAGEFFRTANAAIAGGMLKLPRLGRGTADRQPCPTTRDFGIVDQDQSDNVTSSYLVVGHGRIVQNTAANRTRFGARAREIFNGSDNVLLDRFLDPALGCTPPTAPDLADGGAAATSLALNELQAVQQARPVALVPVNDPMTQLDGHRSLAKTNLYRLGVNQPPIDPGTETARGYCRNLVDLGQRRTQLDKSLTAQAASPDPAAASSLFTFLAARLHDSFDELSCDRFLGRENPVKITAQDGVAVDATFDLGRRFHPIATRRPAPSAQPTRQPTPSAQPPTQQPSPNPTRQPTQRPTRQPSPNPTGQPATPTGQPSGAASRR